MPDPMTPTDALAAALRDAEGTVMRYQDDAPNIAPAILAALPDDAALVTVDSLAAAFWDALEGYGHIDVDGGSRGVPEEEETVRGFATAIIRAAKSQPPPTFSRSGSEDAAKEAERE